MFPVPVWSFLTWNKIRNPECYVRQLACFQLSCGAESDVLSPQTNFLKDFNKLFNNFSSSSSSCAGDLTMGGPDAAPPAGQHQTLLPAWGHAEGPDQRARRGGSKVTGREADSSSCMGGSFSHMFTFPFTHTNLSAAHNSLFYSL